VGDDISTTDCDVVANMRSLGAEATCLTKYHEGSEYTSMVSGKYVKEIPHKMTHFSQCQETRAS